MTDVRETLRTGAPKTLKMVRYRWRAGVVKPGCGVRLIQKDGEDGYFHGKCAAYSEIVNNLGCADCHNTVLTRVRQRQTGVNPFRPYVASRDGSHW